MFEEYISQSDGVQKYTSKGAPHGMDKSFAHVNIFFIGTPQNSRLAFSAHFCTVQVHLPPPPGMPGLPEYCRTPMLIMAQPTINTVGGGWPPPIHKATDVPRMDVIGRVGALGGVPDPEFEH